MNYDVIFSEYVAGNLSETSAIAQINQSRDEHIKAGDVREAERALICISYFAHYDDYNRGAISRGEFLMFLHDFVLYLGRSPMPKLVEQVVRESGSAYGLSISEDQHIDASLNLPEWLGRTSFIRDVYSLSPNYQKKSNSALGDSIIYDHSPFSRYRSIEQKIAIHAAIDLPENRTMMVSLPTGGGKSLITQMLAATSAGLTLVIVPTVALAEDQFIQAKACITTKDFSTHIFYYTSDLPLAQVTKMLAEIHSGSARLVISSPEAVSKNLAISEALRDCASKHMLRNVVIDEAHIVPDWGLLFRPDFQIFSVIMNELRAASQHSIRTYLLSATLSDDVVNTLFGLFGQEGCNIQYRCDSLRPEPRYIYSECHNFIERKERVIDLIQCLPKPLITYVLEPKEAEEYRSALKQKGFKNIQTFTGKTSGTERLELLKKWKSNRIDVMIATSAFGMGVDKSNVRTIIHACVPENMSRFYQEVGRAGRDGLPSLSVIIPYIGKTEKQSDLGAAFGLTSKSILGVDKLVARWFSMIRSQRTSITGETAIIDLNTTPSTFSPDEAEHAGNQNMAWNANALLLLHRQKYIHIDSAQYIPDQKTYYFTLQLLNTDLLLNEAAFRQALTPDRAKEQKIRLNGYHQIEDMIHHPKAKCWGKRLTSLFPLAEEICNGCPIHPDNPPDFDDGIKIRESFPLEFEPSKPTHSLKRYLGSYSDVLIPHDNFKETDYDLLVNCANQLDLGCTVLPDTNGLSTTSNSIVLSSDEFVSVAPKAPWLFKKGVLILFSDDAGLNNKLFDITHNRDFNKITKVLLCKEDMMVYSQMRPLNEFLDCNQTTLERLLKE